MSYKVMKLNKNIVKNFTPVPNSSTAIDILCLNFISIPLEKLAFIPC